MYLLYRKIKINDYIKYMSSGKYYHQDEQEKMRNLMNSISTDTNALLEACPSLNSFIETDVEVDELAELQRQYYNAVNDANNIKNRLITTEKKYFKAKYGKKIHNHFIDQRDEHTTNMLNAAGTRSAGSGVDAGAEESIDSLEATGTDDEIKTRLQYYNNLYTTVNTGIENINKNVTTMVNSTEINKRKIEYRHDVSEKTMRLSGIFNYIYYFIVLFIFIILISKNALDIKKNIILYIVILIFPLIYRYVFMFLVYIYNLIAEYLKVRGPKDVYLNKSLDIKFLDDYDI